MLVAQLPFLIGRCLALERHPHFGGGFWFRIEEPRSKLRGMRSLLRFNLPDSRLGETNHPPALLKLALPPLTAALSEELRSDPRFYSGQAFTKSRFQALRQGGLNGSGSDRRRQTILFAKRRMKAES